MFPPLKQSNQEAPFFSIISKNLTFEAENDKNEKNDSKPAQQNDNTNVSSAKKDENLDSALDDLKIEKEKKETPNGQPSSSSADSSSGDVQTDSENDDGSNDPTGRTPDETTSPAVQQNDSTSGIDVPPSEGHANRKLTLYAEYNRIYNALKESVESLSRTQTCDDKIKSCVAQLQDVVTDVRFIMSVFQSYAETDLMIHLQLVKERTSLVMEQIQRINTN